MVSGEFKAARRVALSHSTAEKKRLNCAAQNSRETVVAGDGYQQQETDKYQTGMFYISAFPS